MRGKRRKLRWRKGKMYATRLINSSPTEKPSVVVSRRCRDYASRCYKKKKQARVEGQIIHRDGEGCNGVAPPVKRRKFLDGNLKNSPRAGRAIKLDARRNDYWGNVFHVGRTKAKTLAADTHETRYGQIMWTTRQLVLWITKLRMLVTCVRYLEHVCQTVYVSKILPSRTRRVSNLCARNNRVAVSFNF